MSELLENLKLWFVKTIDDFAFNGDDSRDDREALMSMLEELLIADHHGYMPWDAEYMLIAGGMVPKGAKDFDINELLEKHNLLDWTKERGLIHDD